MRLARANNLCPLAGKLVLMNTLLSWGLVRLTKERLLEIRMKLNLHLNNAKRKTCWNLELLTMNNDDEKGSVVSVESFYCHCRYFINLWLPMRGNMFHTAYVKWYKCFKCKRNSHQVFFFSAYTRIEDVIAFISYLAFQL